MGTKGSSGLQTRRRSIQGGDSGVRVDWTRLAFDVEARDCRPSPEPTGTHLDAVPELKSPTNRLLYSWSPDSRLNDLEHLHWRRHQEPLHQALARAQADDLDALGRVNRTNSDYLAWRRLQPVKPFKIDPNHWTLFEIGFDLGLNKLSSEELADCFDAVCPCGRIHDADALKKQRARFRTAIKKVARTSPPTPLS